MSHKIYLGENLGGDGFFTADEAIELMTDEWIAGGNYCEQTMIDLRDELKNARGDIHLHIFAGFCGGIIFGMGIVFLVLASVQYSTPW